MYTVLRLFEIRILNSNQTCPPFTHLLHDLDNAIVFPLQLFNYFIPLIWKIFLYINIRKMNVHTYISQWTRFKNIFMYHIILISSKQSIPIHKID